MLEATLFVILTTSFIVGLSGALMPGPLLALTIGGAARRGFWAGPLIVLGHGILELTLVVGLISGLSQFLKNELVFSIIGIAGGIVLLVMGLSTIRRGWQKATVPLAETVNVRQDRALVISGIVVSVSNPYWIIWWATIGMVYLSWSLKLGMGGIVSFFTGHISADLAWYALVAFIIATGRKALKDSVYRWLLIICGLALVMLGGYFLTSGIRFLVS
ncbi:MAG: LysE family transporter [Chloroflexota bacterium]